MDLPTTELATHPKAILFAPTEREVVANRQLVKNLVLSLESSLALPEDKARVDVEYVESKLVEFGRADRSPVKPRPKRASRLAAIEALKKCLIDHLRSARDHARATLDMSGEAQLLPRPKQKELAKRLGLSQDQVSNSINDPQALELKIYYDLAGDIDQVTAWTGPISAGWKKKNRS